MSRDETPKRSVTASADRTSSAPSGSHSRSGGGELPSIAPSSLRIRRLSVRPGRPERTDQGPEVASPAASSVLSPPLSNKRGHGIDEKIVLTTWGLGAKPREVIAGSFRPQTRSRFTEK